MGLSFEIPDYIVTTFVKSYNEIILSDYKKRGNEIYDKILQDVLSMWGLYLQCSNPAGLSRNN